MSEEVVLNLENLGGGAAAELFNAELQHALDNIADPNTKPDQVREVTLKLKVKPSENRRSATIEVAASSKLAPVRPHSDVIYIGKKHGKNVATGSDARQLAFGVDLEQEGRAS